MPDQPITGLTAVTTALGTDLVELGVDPSGTPLSRKITLADLMGVGARVFNSAAESISNNLLTTLTFDSERYDYGGFHSTSVNTSRLTCPVAGIYAVTAHVRWESNNSGHRHLEFLANGVSIGVLAIPAVQGTTHHMSFAAIYAMAAAEYFEVTVFQSSGTSLNIEAASALSPEFSIHLLGRT